MLFTPPKSVTQYTLLFQLPEKKATGQLTPPSLENTPTVLVGIEVNKQQDNPGQVVVNPLQGI